MNCLNFSKKKKKLLFDSFEGEQIREKKRARERKKEIEKKKENKQKLVKAKQIKKKKILPWATFEGKL